MCVSVVVPVLLPSLGLVAEVAQRRAVCLRPDSEVTGPAEEFGPSAPRLTQELLFWGPCADPLYESQEAELASVFTRPLARLDCLLARLCAAIS